MEWKKSGRSGPMEAQRNNCRSSDTLRYLMDSIYRHPIVHYNIVGQVNLKRNV